MLDSNSCEIPKRSFFLKVKYWLGPCVSTLKISTDVNWRPEPQLCWQLDYSVQK